MAGEPDNQVDLIRQYLAERTIGCPVGLNALRKRITWVSAKLAAALGFVITTTAYAIGGRPLFDHSAAAEMGDVALPREETAFHQASRTVNRWIVESPSQATPVILGKIAQPPPPPNICFEQRDR